MAIQKKLWRSFGNGMIFQIRKVSQATNRTSFLAIVVEKDGVFRTV